MTASRLGNGRQRQSAGAEAKRRLSRKSLRMEMSVKIRVMVTADREILT